MKKGLSIILALIVVLFAFPGAFAGSDVSKTKRHVAMVYDDSTSMYVSDKSKKPVLNWAYANYMTQAFLALLNPQDSLYITYMSDTEKEDVSYPDLMKTDKAQAIGDIREKRDFINRTPIEAVQTAYEMLKGLEEELTDEYWLVVITDGGFTDYEGDMTQMLSDYIEEMAALGKTLKVVFLAIGDDTEAPDGDEDKGLLVYRTGTDEIVTTMAQLADNISGRHNVSSSRMSELSGNKVAVDMMLPVRSLIVFTQADGNTLTDITNSKKEQMQVASSYNISAPDEFKYSKDITTVTDTNAIGAIARITPSAEGTILSDGRYTLSFASDVDLNNIRVMYEPALDVVLRYKQDGKTVTNPADGSVCDIEVLLVNALTGSPLNAKVLPAEVGCAIQIVSDGKTVASADGYSIENVELKSGNLSVNTEITMPGYFVLRNRQDYVYEALPQATPTPVPREYDETAGPWPPDVTLKVEMPEGTQLGLKTLEQGKPFLVIPMFNGEKGQLSDLQMGELQIICSRKIEFETYIDEGYMGFAIAPKYYGNIYSTSTGTINADVYFKSEYEKTAQTVIVFDVKDISWLERHYRIIVIPFAAVILAILILGILVFRVKFCKGSWIEYTQMHKNLNGEWVASKSPASVSLNNLKGRWRMIPFAKERMHISNIVFFPHTDDQYIIIPKSSLKGNMGTPRRQFTKKEMQSDYYLLNGSKIYLEIGNTRIVFSYHAPRRTLLTKKKGK